jgi:hypothetical protein
MRNVPTTRRRHLDGSSPGKAAAMSEIKTPAPVDHVVGWIYEDELPKNYPYDAMFPHSKVDGVRMFPVFAPAPRGAEPTLEWGNFEGPKINVKWKPDDQDLIYTALNVYDGEGDMDDDAREQIIERLLAAWKSAIASEQLTFDISARLLKERDRFRDALREIVDPISAMRQLAADEGARLDGMMAVTLAKDPEYLKGIARAALAAASEGSTDGN